MSRISTIIGLIAIAGCSLAAGAVGTRWLGPKLPPLPSSHIVTGEDALDDESNPSDSIPLATTIRPKHDPSLTVEIHNIATVEAFFQSDLRARASGIIRSITKGLGDSVQAGELILTIDVPDLEQEVAQRAALVGQRKQEVRVAESKLGDAIAQKEVARAAVRLKETEVDAASATADLRRKRLDRYRQLAGTEAVTPVVVEEEERNFQAAGSALAGAKVAVEKAEADLRGADAAIATARTDIGLRESMVEVAERDLDRTRALADYARIRAPFSGIIMRRNVDPGDFVQNATAGASETLISIARTDLITVVSKLPENVAPYLTKTTEATMEFDDLPGVTFAARVARFPPMVQTSDRTVRVEIDLFNAGRAAYQRFVAKAVGASFTTLAATGPISTAMFASSGMETLGKDRKGVADPLPPLPIISGTTAREPRLLAGMVGTIRLHLQRFADTCVVPATAVFSRGGKTYLLEVRDGVTQLLPVMVQVSDGAKAKVAVVARVADARGGTREVFRELTGNEELVASRQAEFPPGKPVKTAPMDW